MIPRPRWWHGPRLPVRLGALLAWGALISTLHAFVNARVPVGGPAARTVPVGGLPVT